MRKGLDGLGDRVRGLREAKGWERGELAARSQLHVSLIQRYEEGPTQPTAANLAALAAGLEVRVDRLVRDIPPERYGVTAAEESLYYFLQETPQSSRLSTLLATLVNEQHAPRTALAWQQMSSLLAVALRHDDQSQHQNDGGQDVERSRLIAHRPRRQPRRRASN